jgi:deoxyribodipyrimidine photo-lyase
MRPSPSIVWLRDDLRITDNPALDAAVRRGGPVIVLYLLDDASPEVRPLGAASRWWLHHSLERLRDALRALGADLTLRRGSARTELPALVEQSGAGAVYWNRRYGAAREVDTELKTRFTEEGLEVQSFQGSLLFEPWTIRTGAGTPFKVFTPFWRACLAAGEPREPLAAPTALEGVEGLASDDLDDWELLPTAPDWAEGLRETWTPGEAGAHERLEAFADEHLGEYHRRDEPAVPATSMLSPHLKFGELSPFQIWHRLQHDLDPAARRNRAKFLSELGWREFSYTILFHFTELGTKNFRPEFDAMPWRRPEAGELEAWQHGRTGIPIVDAGMRELWRTGYMHNRVRMITASFLTKNLRIDWREGEAWFWDCLVDADEANNSASWQWVAGSGADAAPYFRVFNPELQAKKFDGHGLYVNRWVPEAGTPAYPEPIVDLKQSRQEALDAYEEVKAAARS